MRLVPILAVICGLSSACGEKPPARYVIESDLGDQRFRRYQQVLDVELPVAGNPAVGHTGAYVRSGPAVQVTPVVVTVYERAAGLADAVRQQLRAMEGYSFDVTSIAGEHVWRMRGEAGDQWVLWVSDRHLAKVGAPEGASEVPVEVVEAYLERYPSDLDKQGHARAGATSAGAAPQEGAQADERRP